MRVAVLRVERARIATVVITVVATLVAAVITTVVPTLVTAVVPTVVSALALAAPTDPSLLAVTRAMTIFARAALDPTHLLNGRGPGERRGRHWRGLSAARRGDGADESRESEFGEK